jgi:hypothetical protein
MHLYLNDILALLFSFCRSNQRLSLFTQTLKNVDKKLILFSIMFFCHQSMYMNNVMMYKRKQKNSLFGIIIFFKIITTICIRFMMIVNLR